MPVRFEDNEDGYLGWLANNPHGLVVNSYRRPKPRYLLLHRATCPSISSASRTNYTTTGYIKLCATEEAVLARWARDQVGGSLSRCGVCKP